jgi:hypothetical protein
MASLHSGIFDPSFLLTFPSPFGISLHRIQWHPFILTWMLSLTTHLSHHPTMIGLLRLTPPLFPIFPHLLFRCMNPPG